MRQTFPIIEHAKRVARSCFLGIAIPCELSTVDGGVIIGEKVLKFKKSAVAKIGKYKSDGRHNVAAEDKMIVPVGKPGSRARIEDLAIQYATIEASGSESSAFAD